MTQQKFTYYQQAQLFKILYNTATIKQFSTINKKSYSTEISNYLWELKDKHKNYKQNLEILCRTKTKPNSNKTFKLSSLEK